MSGRFNKQLAAVFFTFLIFVFLIPQKNVSASQGPVPMYPNLESFSIKNSPIEEYVADQAGLLLPTYFFPELQGYQTTTLNDYAPLYMTGGSFSLSGETGPDGNVTGSFNYSGYSRQQWESGEFDLYEVTAKGQITNAKAAYDDKGFLRIMGAAHYERKFEFSGPVTITMKYSTLVWDENADGQVRIEGTVTAQAQIAFLSCISDEKDINLCHFSAGKGYGDYGFEGSFINSTAYDDFVWFNNLDFEFQLIEGINFDPEAHHKLTPQTEEGEQEPEEEIILDESYLDAPEKVEKIADNPDAGFTALILCNDQIMPEDGINCSLNILHGKENQPYTVNWILDGYVIKSGTVLLDADNFIFPNPPPGDHSVEVQVMDQSTFDTRVSSAFVEVLMPIDADKIKPWTQAMAGAGSVAILGAWLWSEWLRARREVQEQNIPRTDIPDWMDPYRSLKDIWASDAAEEKQRRGLKDYTYNPDEDRLESPEYRKAVKFAEDQSGLKNRYWKQRDAIADLAKNNPDDPLWKQLDELLVKNFDKVFNNGQWDAKQLKKLEDAVARLGGLELGSRLARDYTYKDAAIDTVGQASQSLTVRILAAMLSMGRSEVVLQPLSTSYNMYKNITDKKMDYKQSYFQAIEETKSYAKWSIAFWGFFKGLATAGAPLAKAAAKGIGNKIIETFGKSGMQAIDKAKQIWQTLNSPITQKGREALAKKLAASAAKTAPPVIRQGWGKPVVSYSSPNFAKGPVPGPPMNWVDKVNAMDKINPRMSNYVTNLMGKPGGPELRSMDMIQNQSDVVLTNDERVALKLLNTIGYREAVKDGLVPRQVIAATNHVRTKMVQLSVSNAYNQLTQSNPELAKHIARIDFTNTGARPQSPAATSGFTDLDLTPVGDGTPAGRQAEMQMTKLIRANIQKGYDAATDTWLGPDPRLADIHVYPGLHPQNPAPAGGYGSKELVYWQSKSIALNARSMVPTTKGNMMCNAHPDVAPTPATSAIPEQGPMAPIPKPPFKIDIPRAKAEAARVMINNLKATSAQMTQPLTRLDALRSEGKHVVRVWNLANSGSGKPMPPQVQKLLSWKTDKTIVPSAEEVNEVWDYVINYLPIGDSIEIIR